MARYDAADLARLLGQRAEAVCRHYLSHGRREGNYWLVGDVHNTPGRSLFVHLAGPETGKGAAGKWTDSATGEHGDLLDLIHESRGLRSFREVADEARAFLSLPPDPIQWELGKRSCHRPSVTAGSIEAVRRLWNASVPITGTLAETYLRKRGLVALCETVSLRYQPRCFYRPEVSLPPRSGPALIAAVTDEAGRLTGMQRTWLDPATGRKARIKTPRRALGTLLGHAVRFGMPLDVMAAGEGIETVLSLRMVLPLMPMVAALSANHLSAILFPQQTPLRRLYIVRDADPAGDGARDRLTERAEQAGIEAVTLSPVFGDFNDDLRRLGMTALRESVRRQLVPEDVERFMAG